jgi:hypothetical protein
MLSNIQRNQQPQPKHTYFVVAKYSSKSEVSTYDVEYQIVKSLHDLGDGIEDDIVQLGQM